MRGDVQTVSATNADLERIALRVRERCIRLSTDGGCFLGASLSAVDLIVYLYERFLNIPSVDDPERDYFFLSKGHDVPALYGYFAETGRMAADRLTHHLKTSDSVYWHPNRNIPGVEFHSGSLGHLLSVGIGVALDCKWRGTKNRVVVVVGDGELDEGSNWEAMLVAQAYELDNLVVVVDRNAFQANARTEDLIRLEPLDKKFEAFNASVTTIDGHDFAAMEEAFSSIPFAKGRPNVIIGRTKRGKGLPSIEERADRWFCNFTGAEVDGLVRELHGGTTSALKSETLVVR